MSPIYVGYLGFILLIILTLLNTPLAISLGVLGIAGLGYLIGWDVALETLRTTPYLSLASYDNCVIPLFILMGEFCYTGGISSDLYATVNKWLGHIRGGLAMATVGACALFAAVSGSSQATAAAMGTVALPEMKKYRYDAGLASGCVAAGGTIGIMIPPSVPLIIYGMLTRQSIGKLFMAGIIPGILQALLYILIIYLLCRNNPLLGPPARNTNLKEKIVSLKSTWTIIVLFVVVMGGIYLGIFSPTEAAAIGAFGAFLLALFRRQLTRSKFVSALLETGKSTAALLLILLGVAVFTSFLSITRMPFELASTITTFDAPPYVVLTAILILYLVLGFFILPMPMIILTVPLLAPIVQALGFDLVWFGILIIITVETGQITPPVAMNLFVIQALDKNIRIGDIYRGVWPFIYSNIAFLIMIVAIPSIALFLPNVMH